MFGYGPATFGNSFGAADSGPAVGRQGDPYAWAQRLRDIPDGEPLGMAAAAGPAGRGAGGGVPACCWRGVR